jgi:hypothetical protein
MGSLLAAGILCSFLFFACSDDAPTIPGATSKVEGRVTDDIGFDALAKSMGNVEGAAVTIARVQSDGSLLTVSNDTVFTDANGQFLVETDADGERGLIVVATKGTDVWRALISAELKQGTTIRCQPLNDETTLEADIYLSVVENGLTDLVYYTDIAPNIDTDVANMLSGNAGAVDELTAAFEAKAGAHSGILNDTTIGGTESQLEALVIARMQAQASLEAALLQAENQAAIDAAFDQFNEAAVNAYAESGLSLAACATAREVSAKALLKNTASLSSELQFGLNQMAARLRAFAVDRAVQASFADLGATEGVSVAGAVLRTSVSGASNIAQIETAFADYHDTIIDGMQNVSGDNAAAILTIDTAINASAGAKLILDATVSAAITTDALVDAYAAYISATRTLVEGTLSGANSTEVEAISNIIVLVNLQV